MIHSNNVSRWFQKLVHAVPVQRTRIIFLMNRKSYKPDSNKVKQCYKNLITYYYKKQISIVNSSENIECNTEIFIKTHTQCSTHTQILVSVQKPSL